MRVGLVVPGSRAPVQWCLACEGQLGGARPMRVGLVVPGFSADADDWCIPALRHLARTLARTDDVRVVAVRYPYRAARYSVEGASVIAIGGAEARGGAALEV